MSSSQVSRRLATLEREVARIKASLVLSLPAKRRWWIEDAGRFADDQVFEEIVRLGKAYRRSKRPPGLANRQ